MSVVSPPGSFSSIFTAREISGGELYEMMPASHPIYFSNAQTTSFPEVVWRAGKIGPEWELVRPILLSVEWDEDGECIVTDTFSVVYGNGPTVTKAQQDYCDSLIEYYEALREGAKGNVQTALAFFFLSQRVKHNPVSK